jgi:hypothetical protein
MIGLLEWIIFFNALGALTVSYAFYTKFFTVDIILFFVSIAYILIPMEKVSKFLMPVENNEEVKHYLIWFIVI